MEQEREGLGEYQVEEQEKLLIDDLLNIFMGVEGSFIRRVDCEDSSNHIIQHVYSIEQPCDSSLCQMVNKLLQLALHNDTLQLYSSLNHNLHKG